MTRRRALFCLGAAAFFPAAAGAAPQAPDDIHFRVWRKGSEIGSHHVAFQSEGGRLIVRSAADLAVSFGPIVLYRYSYRAEEVWEGGRLLTVRSRTDDNGKQDFAEMERTGDRFSVNGSKSGRYLAPAGAIAATHWNPAELDQPMINPQNGELMSFERRDLGAERLPWGQRARHIALTGYARLDLWYDESAAWRALRAVASDGSLIDYRPAERNAT